MRFIGHSRRQKRTALLWIVACIAVFSLVAFVLMQRWYAQGKQARMNTCADFSSMLSVAGFKGDSKTLVLIGDSRIAEWPSDALSGRFQVLNWGVSGATVPELLCGLDRYPHWRGADAYVVQAGINDLVSINATHRWFSGERQKAIHQTGSQLTALVEAVASGGSRTIFLETLPPYRLDMLRRLLWGPHVAASATELNQMQMRFNYPSNVQYVKLTPLFVNGETRRWRDDYSRDALHWQPAAYRAIELSLFKIE